MNRGKTYYENGKLKCEYVDFTLEDNIKDGCKNIIKRVQRNFNENGKLKEVITFYHMISQIEESDQLFIKNKDFMKEINFKIQEYTIDGKLHKITAVGNSKNTIGFLDLIINYNEKREIIYAELNFIKNTIKYFYKNRKLDKVIDENGMKKSEEVEEREYTFLGKIFNNLGVALSDIDVKETLININSAFEKYKK